MKPLSLFSPEYARSLRFVLTDIDDTLTRGGKLDASTYKSLESLAASGLIVIPITGGPAGWADMIARMWPVNAVIAESGAVAYTVDSGVLREYPAPGAEPARGSVRLGETLSALHERFPEARLAKNQFCRIYDTAIDYAEDKPGLSRDVILEIKHFLESRGASTGLSSIHLNFWFGPYDKAGGAESFLSRCYNYNLLRDRESVLYVGDSSNDEPMFKIFPLSVGVANIRNFADTMTVLPSYITRESHGKGFCEIVSHLLKLRGVHID